MDTQKYESRNSEKFEIGSSSHTQKILSQTLTHSLTRTHARTHTHVHAHTRAHTHTHTHARTHAHTHAHTHSYMIVQVDAGTLGAEDFEKEKKKLLVQREEREKDAVDAADERSRKRPLGEDGEGAGGGKGLAGSGMFSGVSRVSECVGDGVRI